MLLEACPPCACGVTFIRLENIALLPYSVTLPQGDDLFFFPWGLFVL